MNSQQLFRYSRLRLATWYALVMGDILSLSGLVMYRALLQSRWMALEREIESIAGTLHDSLEPMLPASATPATVLAPTRPKLVRLRLEVEIVTPSASPIALVLTPLVMPLGNPRESSPSATIFPVAVTLTTPALP